jgi:energy-coupling factor transporter ATP-binding protein EcfA2
MKIESVFVSNFRCFGPDGVEINIQNQVTALVGSNGSGKTALFQSLSRLFGITRSARTVTKVDFHIDHDEEAVVDGQSLIIECLLGFPELEDDGQENTDAIPDFFNHMAASEPNEPLKARIRLIATWINDGTPEGTVEEDIRWITTLDEDFEWENCPKVSAVDRARIQLVYVPALRNASERVTELLKGRLWKAALWSSELAKHATSGAELIQDQFDNEAPANFITDRLTNRWQQIYEGDTDTTPNLRLVENRFEELVRRAEFIFYPDEAGRDRSLIDLSDGQRSLFHIALTAATLETEQDALALEPSDCPFDQEKLRRTHLTILAIEEPENSLSPFFLSRIMLQAREIGAMDNAQAIISSHSASILSRVEPEEVRYFRLNRETKSTSIKSLTLPEDDEEASKYVRLAVRSYPELYFARFIILAEGDSERIVLPRLAEAMGVPLDPSFVPVVPLGGRYVSHFWRLVSDLGIPHATLLDFDFGRSHGGANVIRTTVEALNAIGRDLAGNPLVQDGIVDLEDLGQLTDDDVAASREDNNWLQAFKHEGVYFSDPIDLDFAMLAAFPEAYQHPNPGGHGPRRTGVAIAEKKRVVLKTNGNPDLYEDNEWDDCFAWYPYLFLNRSKPETHLAALNRISPNDLAVQAPAELRALITHIKQVIFPNLDDE